MRNENLKIYDYVMGQLRAKRVPQRTLARETGVPFSTLCKIAQGYTKEPSVHAIQRLADYFHAQDVI
ncbi:helix-turn-helix transcriptional regulator [Sulfuriferula sp.]|uniref:helix-turn-helix domain-containing protein n=1 Tax=Sulfuriferula sp. TaxID=2025307 RepID=UPI00272F8DF2|nr:helix-turn-helix transcriptional regulator [Sulfuriferula sp.]MDP2026428.1 helix-turn-helix transcriptional regulator [Sulfuriferula sp.]